jgi:hypothetical protein
VTIVLNVGFDVGFVVGFVVGFDVGFDVDVFAERLDGSFGGFGAAKSSISSFCPRSSVGNAHASLH